MVSTRLVIFQISRNCKYFKLCYPHFLFDIPSRVRRKFSKNLVSTRLVIFSDFKELQIFQAMFFTIFVWYTQLFFIFTGLVIFSEFKEFQIFQVMFSTLFVWYTKLCQTKKISIGFHATCHFYRFQGISNISSYDFYTFCLIYQAL